MKRDRQASMELHNRILDRILERKEPGKGGFALSRDLAKLVAEQKKSAKCN